MRKVRLAVNNNIFLMSIERELSKYYFRSKFVYKICFKNPLEKYGIKNFNPVY